MATPVIGCLAKAFFDEGGFTVVSRAKSSVCYALALEKD